MTPLNLLCAGAIAAALASWLGLRRRFKRPYLVINPAFQRLLTHAGLNHADSFIELPAVIVSGHPDRNVARLRLGETHAFLKREHRVSWKERLANAWAGFGWVSKSHREGVILQELNREDIACPQWIAYGQTKMGEAFLLISSLPSCIDFRTAGLECRSDEKSRSLLLEVSRALARLHAKGFDHPDLYAKHVHLDPSDRSIYFLDWQRSRRRSFLAVRHRVRDLAAFWASLPDSLATVRAAKEFTDCYLAEASALSKEKGLRIDAEEAVTQILALARRLARTRPVRHSRQAIPASIGQEVIWLKGESLCITPSFQNRYKDKVPDFLEMGNSRSGNRERGQVDFGNGVLRYRREFRPLAWIRERLGGHRLLGGSVIQAGLLFRLARHEIAVPQLWAFGHRRRFGGWIHSFLLHEKPALVSLAHPRNPGQELAKVSRTASAARRDLIRQVGQLLAKVHEAGCRFACIPVDGIDIGVSEDDGAIKLGGVECLKVYRGRGRQFVIRDILALRSILSPLIQTRSDELRFLRAYGVKKFPRGGDRRLARQLLARRNRYSEFSRMPGYLGLFHSWSGHEPRLGWRHSA